MPVEGSRALGLPQGPRALVIGSGINSRAISDSGPGQGDLPVMGTSGPSLRWPETTGKFWKNFINPKEVFDVGIPGGGELWCLFRPSWRRLEFSGMDFSATSPPSVSLVLGHLPNSYSLSLTLSSDSGFSAFFRLSHLSPSCCQPLPCLWTDSHFPSLVTSDRPAIRIGRVSVFRVFFF